MAPRKRARKLRRRTDAQVAQHMAMGTGRKSFRGTIGLVGGRRRVKIGRSGVMREIMRAEAKYKKTFGLRPSKTQRPYGP